MAEDEGSLGDSESGQDAVFSMANFFRETEESDEAGKEIIDMKVAQAIVGIDEAVGRSADEAMAYAIQHDGPVYPTALETSSADELEARHKTSRAILDGVYAHYGVELTGRVTDDELYELPEDQRDANYPGYVRQREVVYKASGRDLIFKETAFYNANADPQGLKAPTAVLATAYNARGLAES